MAANRQITSVQYQALLTAFRDYPGNIARASRASGVDRRTAKRGWEQGWAVDGRRVPIREIVAEEQAHARARVKELEDQVGRQTAEAEAHRRITTVSKALEDVTASRVQEAQMIRLARGATIGLFAGVATLTRAVPKIAVRVQQGLEALAASNEPVTTTEMLNLTRLTSQLIVAVRQLAESGQRVMEMDRLLLGEPTSITRTEHTEITMEEAAERIEAGRRALEYARREGIIVDVSPVKELPLPAEQVDDGLDAELDELASKAS